MSKKSAKIALLAAASAVAASVGGGLAQANDFDYAGYATVVEAPVQADIVHADEQKSPAANKWALLAVAAGALAGLVKLIGGQKIVESVKEAAPKAAKAAKNAAGKAARAAGSAIRSPLLFLAVLAGLAVFALTGVGLYDIEWIGGMAAGIALAGVSEFGLSKLKIPALRPIRIRKNDHGK